MKITKIAEILVMNKRNVLIYVGIKNVNLQYKPMH